MLNLSSIIKQPRLVVVIVLVLIGLTSFQSFVGAQESTSPNDSKSASISGTLRDVDKKGNRTPVPNVRITVSIEGNKIGEATSDAEGKWRIEVPRAGIYSVKIETSTLPEGVTLVDSDKKELPSVSVQENQSKVVIFRLGESIDSGSSRLDHISNLFLSGLRLGAVIAMAGVGLSLIFSVTNFVNFAHGEFITLGAMITYLFSTSAAGPSWHLLIAVIPTILVVGGLATGLEFAIWKPLRKKGTNDLSLMIISIGLSLTLRHLYLVIIGTQSRAYKNYSSQETISFLSFTTTPKTLWIIFISVAILLFTGIFLLVSKHGTSLRALSSNPTLAKASGINTNKTILVAWIVGTATTGISGVLLGISHTSFMGYGLATPVASFCRHNLGRH